MLSDHFSGIFVSTACPVVLPGNQNFNVFFPNKSRQIYKKTSQPETMNMLLHFKHHKILLYKGNVNLIFCYIHTDN